jgi:hypothetical protein
VNKVIGNVNEVLHRIKVKLYPNYLSGASGVYIAKTHNEAVLSVEDVCAAAKNRGGFTGSYDDLVKDVKVFFEEAAYQLTDGFAVNTGWFSLHPKVGGTFSKTGKSLDTKKHKVDFSFRPMDRLWELADNIEVEIEGVANTSGFIDSILDVRSGELNRILSPGGALVITGSKIKLAGDHPDVGIWFYQDIPNTQPVKVTENLSENSSIKLIAAIPALQQGSLWRLQIVTQFTNGSLLLKTPRIIEFPTELTIV